MPSESGMFDIKREVASPAASKEEEDEEDEVKTFLSSCWRRLSFKLLSWWYFSLQIEYGENFEPAISGGGRSAELFAHSNGLAA